MASHGRAARHRWACVFVLALVSAVPGCGGDGSSGGSDDASETPTENAAAAYDGTWSGTVSTGGSIEFTVTDGVITAAKITTGEDVYGPRCGTVSGENEFPDTEIAIDDGQFSWGGSGSGHPVEGHFDSETTASGTADFGVPEVSGEPVPDCHPATATWEATIAGATVSSSPTEASTPTEDAAGVSASSAECVAGLGYEIAEAGATDLPIADADGEGLPVVDGSAGIGIRGEEGAAVYWVYETDDAANAAYAGVLDNPDIDQIAPRVDVIAIDNTFVISGDGFVSDDRFYLADCFD